MFIIEMIKTKLRRVPCRLPFGITSFAGSDGIVVTSVE